jgi:hypothetical protein
VRTEWTLSVVGISGTIKPRFRQEEIFVMTRNNSWVERKFSFDFPVTEYVDLLERLRSTPGRLDTLLKSLPRQVLTRRDGDSWSIQENVGHLLGAESLFEGRLDDYENGASTLRAADLSGRKTNEANYNEVDLATILRNFRSRREVFLARLEKLKPESFGMSAMHPRLNKPMRLCDMMFFEAEHDDHHLARIRELIERFASGG